MERLIFQMSPETKLKLLLLSLVFGAVVLGIAIGALILMEEGKPQELDTFCDTTHGIGVWYYSDKVSFRMTEAEYGRYCLE